MVAACSNGGSSNSTTISAGVPAGPHALPADPISITFDSTDGTPLSGYYYPAATNPAPVVVLMHWELGDMSDWYQIAPWLQHRGVTNTFPYTAHSPWEDPSWFPALPDGASYGVFVFGFRGCTSGTGHGGCTDWTPDGWLADARAALQQATTLTGADPTRVVAVGAGIGADGATGACQWLNQQQPGACRGAMALSPGSYLQESFGTNVHALGASSPPVPVWCLASSPQETGLCDAPGAADNTAYRAVAVSGGSHAMGMVDPGASPSALQSLLDFLTATVPR